MPKPFDRPRNTTTTRRMALSALVVGTGVGAGSLLARSRLLRRPPKQVALLTKEHNGQRLELPAGPDDAPSRGPGRAPVSMVLFADFECGLSRRHATTLDRLLAT